MIGSKLPGNLKRRRAASCLGLLAGIIAQTALAADCPGHPDALGTSRTLVVDPREHPRLGTMQYPETLPLEDHEVVLTFDDGPLPRNSNQVLDILASQCVKATFFIIGRMAMAYPDGVRRVRDAGHTVGTHSQDHPLSMNRMPIERARQEIDDGIASVTAALGDSTAPAPFFRIPGLLRAEGVEDYLASLGIQTWSADFPADDWRPISSSRVYDLAIRRLEDKGRGILLLHDIQPRTVAALPRILHELKARGYRIVHVVPATPELPATPTMPQQWQLHPPSETVAISHWPKIPSFVFAGADTLPVPMLSDSEWRDGEPVRVAAPPVRKLPSRGVPLPEEALWPRQTPPQPEVAAAAALPVPAQSIFEIQESPRTYMLARAPSFHPPQEADPARRDAEAPAKTTSAGSGHFRRQIRGKHYLAHVPRRGAIRQAARARRGAPRHFVQVKKGSV